MESMWKALLLLAATAILWVPAVSVAGDSSASSVSELSAKNEAAQVKSGPNNPASTCKGQRNHSNFASSHNSQTFTQFYGPIGGKGHGAGANAFGKCVSTSATHVASSGGKESGKSHGEDSQGQDSQGKNDQGENDQGENDQGENDQGKDSQGKDSANPAMTCKSMQSQDASAFNTAYGTRPNAFGKCVSSHTHSKNG
jgi:hypothetical protein